MHTAQRCVHHTLATGPIGTVELCRACGCVSVNVGPTTLRLEPRAFHQLVGTLHSASEALRRAAEDRYAPTSPGGNA